MPTNTAFLTSALEEIGVVTAGETAQSADIQDALEAMNQMMAMWAVSDKDVGYFPQDTLGDSVPLPIWAEEAVKANLCVKLCSIFRIPANPELINKAMGGESMVLRECIKRKLEGADMDHMPIGLGYGRYNIESDQF